VIFHFDFATWRKMLHLAWGEPDAHTRRRILRKLLVTVPLVASFHALCFYLDGIFFPGLRHVEIRTPVFVVGHARSGTTLIHRLLGEDSERFCFFRLYEMHFPSLLQKRIIRLGARLDRRLFGGFLERRVQAFEERRYGRMRAVHKMGLRLAEEDDMIFYWSCASGFWITEMPYMGELDFYDVDHWPTGRRRRLMRFYRDCIKRQLLLDGKEKVFLSKAPVYAGRVETLIQAFPDARFVVPLRSPEETIPSLLKLVSQGWQRLAWDETRVKRCLRVLAEQSFATYRHPQEVLDQHPTVPRAMVDYRELATDPAKSVLQVYQQLGFRVRPSQREALLAEGKRSQKHVSSHTYSLEEFGLAAGEIRERLADLFERYQWGGEGTA